MCAVGFVNLLAEISQSHALILAMPFAKVRQDAPKRLVAVVVILELLQSREQSVPAPFCDTNGKQNKKRIQTCFLNHHTMFSQIFGNQRGGNASLPEMPRHIESRRHNR